MSQGLLQLVRFCSVSRRPPILLRLPHFPSPQSPPKRIVLFMCASAVSMVVVLAASVAAALEVGVAAFGTAASDGAVWER